MSPSRTRPCDARTRDGRLQKANEFLVGAEAIPPGSNDAYVALCVLAGVAAADVVCCASLGEHASGSNHNEAVALLARVDKQQSGCLRTLLGMKSQAEYQAANVSDGNRVRAGRAAAALVDAARRTRLPGSPAQDAVR